MPSTSGPGPCYETASFVGRALIGAAGDLAGQLELRQSRRCLHWSGAPVAGAEGDYLVASCLVLWAARRAGRASRTRVAVARRLVRSKCRHRPSGQRQIRRGDDRGLDVGCDHHSIDFRANAIERDLLASEFDLVAIIEDRHVPAAGYHPIFIDGSWTETIAKHDRGPIWTGERTARARVHLAHFGDDGAPDRHCHRP